MEAIGAVVVLVVLLVLWLASSRRHRVAEQQRRDALRRSTLYSFNDHINTIFVALP